MSFADRDVQCVSCGVMFVFSSGEQEFYREKGFVNEPKHCRLCKAKRDSATNGKRLRRVETPVTCAACGSHTTVPFKPTQKRPVLCATCFKHKVESSQSVAAAGIAAA
ncbi:MAG: zinc-ribbon domain containing protein [Terracidiphilus sp.]